MKRGRKSGARSKRIVELYMSGMKPMDIIREVGCSAPWVYQVLHRENVWQSRADYRPLSSGDDVIKKLNRAGLGQNLLARLLNVSPAAIHKAVRRAR